MTIEYVRYRVPSGKEGQTNQGYIDDLEMQHCTPLGIEFRK